jgi:quinol monooxygenase YgiN
VTIITAPFAREDGNATARSLFLAQTEHTAQSMSDASGSAALRFELMEARAAGSPISMLFVHRQLQVSVAPPAWLAADLAPAESTRRFVTVFPERARWRERPYSEEMAVGRTALLVEEMELRVDGAGAEALRRGWTDFGYNTLSEAGVVRCDLLESAEAAATQDAKATRRFLSRKVFRNEASRAAHEASAHYVRWHAEIGPLLQKGSAPAQLLDTLHPRTSLHPFRTRWAS